ncbi:group 1 glycosyl transferase [Nostoc sp. NIES-4103]|nr:group 1 glycosyl transferase [Nostoc sp. NIES-4103]
MTNKKRLNIVYKTSINRITGLEQDGLILQNLLRDTYHINLYKVTERRMLRKFGLPQYLPSKIQAYLKTRIKKFDANIFLEKIRPELFHIADKNIFIPNHEIFTKKTVPLLQQIDVVLCKTKYAYNLFSDLHHCVKFIGFTSIDRSLPTFQSDYNQYLHLAGKSFERRGTYQILELWKDNPHFPPLTVVAHHIDSRRYNGCCNIRIYNDYVDDEIIRQLQNKIGIHICLSEAEGFGHFIVEAMSCHACIITTDAPPMNELVDPERGYLVSVDREEAVEKYFNNRYFFCLEDFQQTIEKLTSNSVEEKQTKGQLSRKFYEDNNLTFKVRLLQSLESILSS